jgi:hypothetical protein
MTLSHHARHRAQPQPHSQLGRPHSVARHAVRGQAMAEYLVAGAVAIAILAVPVDGSSSVVALLLKAIQTAYQRFLSAIALPM